MTPEDQIALLIGRLHMEVIRLQKINERLEFQVQSGMVNQEDATPVQEPQ